MPASRQGSEAATVIPPTDTEVWVPEEENRYRQRSFLARRRVLFTRIGTLAIFAASLRWGIPDLAGTMMWPGLLLAASGIIMRLWAAGFLRKGEALAVSGPYALMRHPLYFGTGLILCGQSLMSCVPLAPVAAVALWFAIYCPVMREEDAYLADRFGAAFRQYRDLVPAFLPRLGPVRLNPAGFDPADLAVVGDGRFRWSQVWLNREYEGVVVHLLLMAAYVWLNRS